MNMTDGMDFIVRCIVSTGMLYILGLEIYKENHKKISFLNIIFLFAIAICVGINSYSNNPIIRLFGTCLFSGLLFNIVFNCNLNQSLVGSIVTSSVMIASEAIICIVAVFVYMALAINIVTIFENTLIINFLVLAISLLIIKSLKIDVHKLCVRMKLTTNKLISIIVFLIIVMTTILLIKLKLNNWKLNYEFAINCILISMLFGVGLLVYNEKNESERVTKKYTDLAKYTKQNEKLIEQYRLERHENKNQLIIIKNLIGQNDKKALEYVDNLLNIKGKKIKNSWLSDLQYITIPGVKGFLNYKIQEMIDCKINVTLDVSKECGKFKTKEMNIRDEDNIYNLIGIYLDNAKEAAVDSKEKEVCICIYLENKNLVIEIINSFNGKIDLEKIEQGISTKGNGHGFGLRIAKNIVNNNELYTSKYNVKDNYFIQKLSIKEKDKLS